MCLFDFSIGLFDMFSELFKAFQSGLNMVLRFETHFSYLI